MTAEQIARQISIDFSNERLTNCYIGITNDFNRRLLSEHGVNPITTYCKVYSANNENHARAVERYFLNEGMNGGSGGGSTDCTYVYVFLKR